MLLYVFFCAKLYFYNYLYITILLQKCYISPLINVENAREQK